MQDLAEGKRVFLKLQSGQLIPAKVLKCCLDMLALDLSGEFSLSPQVAEVVSRQTKSLLVEGVIMTQVQSIVAFKKTSDLVKSSRPKMLIGSQPVAWISDGQELILTMVYKMMSGFEFESPRYLPQNQDLILRIAVAGEFMTLVGRATQCEESENGIFEGVIEFKNFGRLDSLKWNQNFKPATRELR